MSSHHLHREASDPISLSKRSVAFILSGAAPEKSVHLSKQQVVKRVVTNDSSLLTSTTAHPVVSQKLAGEARDNHALGEQRARQSVEPFNADAYGLCLWV